jgi:polysaccharide biosynthesis/export protein
MRKWLSIVMIVVFIFATPGLSVFSQEGKKGAGSKQTASDAAYDSASYVIGPEDVLYIHVWREEALTRTVPVRADGKISLPLIDEVQAAGLTPLQLKERLTQRLKEFVDGPNVSVVVQEINSFKVFVTGEVRSAGVYRLRSDTSILQIIPMAGGFTEWANQKKIVIIRKEAGRENRILVNYKDIAEGRTPNLILKRDDTIIVP